MKNEYITLAVIAALLVAGGLALTLLGATAMVGYFTVIAALAVGAVEYGSSRKALRTK